jgi:F0F1-type ATP synthase assembly protein I
MRSGGVVFCDGARQMNKKLLCRKQTSTPDGADRFFVLLYGLTFQLAVETVFIILVWMFIGHLLDEKFNLQPFLFIIGFVLGIIIAGINFYRFVCLSKKLCYKGNDVSVDSGAVSEGDEAADCGDGDEKCDEGDGENLGSGDCLR